MKKLILALCLLPLNALAVEQHHANAPVENSAPSAHKNEMMAISDQQLQNFQAHLLAMQAVSNEIVREKDVKKQADLKEQQLELLKAHHAEMMARHGKMQHPPMDTQKMAAMQDYMLTIFNLSSAILATNDLAEQEQLKTKQLELMNAHHASMPMHKGMPVDEVKQKAKVAGMLEMHSLLNQILAETDPMKQAELKAQHIEYLKAHHAEMMAKHHDMMR